MTTPTWLGATPGQPGQAGQINQFLLSHPMSCIYTGTTLSSQLTNGAGSIHSNGLYLAQKFTMSGTVIGRIGLRLAVSGSPAPLRVTLRPDNAGKPSATVLATVYIPKEHLTGSIALYSLPLPVTGLTNGATYWLVADATGDASDYYLVEQSNQASGASTSPDGVTWTAQAYGFVYLVANQTVSGTLDHLWSDNGSRYVTFTYDSIGRPGGIAEYTVAQNGGYVASSRTITYGSGLLYTVT